MADSARLSGLTTRVLNEGPIRLSALIELEKEFVKKISSKTSLQDFAAVVCNALKEAGVEAVLTGGAVVSIYTKNKYQSYDLDFITHAPNKDVERVMTELGFERKGRHFAHPASVFFVEFPSPPLAVGDEPITDWKTRHTELGVLYLLAPTECVMDRLAGYYYWDDKQSMEQAVLVAKAQPFDIKKVRSWSKNEGMQEKFAEFEKRVTK